MPASWISGARSGVNAWECDENNHLNVRFYMTRLSQTMGFVAGALEVGEGRMLKPLTHHIRYRHELRAGDMAEFRTRVAEIRDDSVVLHHELHCAGRVATSFISIDRQVDRATGAPVPWSARQRELMARYAGTIPESDMPRSVDFEERRKPMTLQEARDRGLVEIYRGMVQPWECDVSGRMAVEQVMGRFSDGVGNLFAHMELDVPGLLASGRGSVVVENRLTYGDMPPPGTLVVAHSQVAGFLGKMMRFAHGMFDMRTGARIGASEVIVAILDHATRRAVALSDAERARVEKYLTPLD
ncbi:acyl-CoA thioesterase [Camelimonas abortus]|uniref:Acyl-CoA thioesterase n=1 Tax=Camelimonas abortus TaxID=1017184 RepID=A0ABV7LDL9_9HYPH